MSSIPNITPQHSYPADRPQVIGRIGQQAVSPLADAALEALNATEKQDSVEFSAEALTAAANSPSPETARAQRLAHIKAQIQAGTYDEDSKLTFAADRIARKFAKG